MVDGLSFSFCSCKLDCFPVCHLRRDYTHVVVKMSDLEEVHDPANEETTTTFSQLVFIT